MRSLYIGKNKDMSKGHREPKGELSCSRVTQMGTDWFRHGSGHGGCVCGCLYRVIIWDQPNEGYTLGLGNSGIPSAM